MTTTDDGDVPRLMGQSDEHMELGRRDFMAGAVAFTAAAAAALSPLRHAEHVPTMEQFLQQHYEELTPAQKDQLIARLTREVKEKYGVEAHITDPPPDPGVQFAYMLNLEKCIGCRRCVHACVKENNLSRDPEIQYIRVLKIRKGHISLEFAQHVYSDESVPDPDYYYMPVQCQHCANPPCVKVCPIQATWQEKDGAVVVDYDWCIGCRYCLAACPYQARRFNYEPPMIPADELNPEMGLLSNRPRTVGCTEKCHFCLHRTRVGRYPACVEVCPVGARKFGNVLDPNSEVNYILRRKRIFRLKDELNTESRLYYFFD